MAKKKRRRRRAFAGLPATPPEILTADPCAPKPEMSLIAYGPDVFQEMAISDAKQIVGMVGKQPVLWLNVDGLGDAKAIDEIGDVFNLHHLALEDVLHPVQRAKVDIYPEQIFAVMRMPIPGMAPDTEQLSMFLGKNYIITFQEMPGGDVLDPLRDRLRKSWGMIRTMGPDYLLYAIIDTVCDSYFPVLEKYGEKLDELEDKIFDKSSKNNAKQIHAIKRDIIAIRRAVWPLRDAVASLYRDKMPMITEETQFHLRDCYDHVLRIMDLVETSREYSQDLMDLHLSNVSNRMNEVMKTLTIITAAIMAPTLIAGIYGMNFNPAVSAFNMPELNWPYGYPMALFLMVASALTALLYFRSRGWLGNDDASVAESNGQQISSQQTQPIELQQPTATAPGGNSKD